MNRVPDRYHIPIHSTSPFENVSFDLLPSSVSDAQRHWTCSWIVSSILEQEGGDRWIGFVGANAESVRVVGDGRPVLFFSGEAHSFKAATLPTFGPWFSLSHLGDNIVELLFWRRRLFFENLHPLIPLSICLLISLEVFLSRSAIGHWAPEKDHTLSVSEVTSSKVTP